MLPRNWVEMMMQSEDLPVSHMTIQSADTPVMDPAYLTAMFDDPVRAEQLDRLAYLPVELERLPLDDGVVLIYWHMLRLFDPAASEAA